MRQRLISVLGGKWSWVVIWILVHVCALQQSKHCSATCYEPQLLKIPVVSPFDVDDTFAVTVVEKSVRFPKLANAETVQNMLMDTSSSLANLAAE